MNLHLTHASSDGTGATFAAVANDVPHGFLGQLCGAVMSHSPSISGQEVFDLVKQKYFSSSQNNAFSALKESLGQVIQYLSEREIKFDGAFIVCSKDDAYIAALGRGELGIERNGNAVALAKPGSTSVQFGSGKIQSGDEFILDIQGTKTGLRIALDDQSGVSAAASMRQRLVSVIDTLLQHLPESGRIRINDPSQDVKVHNQRKYAVFFGIFLVVLLCVSVVFGIRRNEQVQKTKAYQQELASARQTLEEARSLKDISKDRARTLLLSARDTIAELRATYGDDAELTIIATSIDDSLGSIAGLYKHAPQIFLDLSLVSGNFSASLLKKGDATVVVFDQASKKLISIDTNSKKTEVLAGPDNLEGVTDIAVYESRVFTLTSGGVNELTKSNSLVIPKEWSGDALTFAFAGNIYVLDKSASQIYRYPGTASGFGAKANWFATDVTVNLEGSASWVIDGSIWVLTQSGKIAKFSLGKVDSFALPSDIPHVTAIYTDDEMEDLYVLDAQNGKIWVLDKRGSFKAEYEDEVIKQVTTFMADTINKKIILAAGSKLFTLEIKH